MKVALPSDPIQLRMRSLTPLSRSSKLEDLTNVFTPNTFVRVPAKFLGRQTALEEVINSLLSEGADIVVFGERGCGKSSIANMLYQVSQGNLDLLDYYGLRQSLEKKGLLSFFWGLGTQRKKFTAIWVDGFGKTVDEVIHAILTRRKDVDYGPGLLAYLPTEADQIEVATKIGFDKVFTSETSLKSVVTTEKPINIKEGFEIAVQRYTGQDTMDLLVIIDEFETVRNKSEIAQYLKSMKRVRFVLVGIADAAIDLVQDHASVARDLHGIYLKPMSGEELRQILEIGSYILSQFCSFTTEATDLIVQESHGSPYWCHFLAKALVDQELSTAGGFENFIQRTTPTPIGPDRVMPLLKSLKTRADCSIYEQLLSQITMDDDRVKKVLLQIAGIEDSVISTAAILRALDRMNEIPRDIASGAVKGMLEMPNTPFEVRARILDNVSFSFKDPNFKRYILLRRAALAD